MVVTEEAFIGRRCNGLIESVAVFASMVYHCDLTHNNVQT